MIREVHVYGKVAALHRTGEGTQHLGLGRALVEEACAQAAAAGYTAINVISAVGTRVYYRNLGFKDAGLYQKRPLREASPTSSVFRIRSNDRAAPRSPTPTPPRSSAS